MKKFLAGLLVIATLFGGVELYGKGFSGGGRSGGGFSGGRSSSFSGSRSGGGFSGSKSTPSAAPRSGGGFGSSSKSTPSTPSSSTRSSSSGFGTSPKIPVTKTIPVAKPTPQSLQTAKTVAINGKTVPREQAVAQFKSDNATKYTSKYTTEPKTRPTHVPATTDVGGKSVTINYNATHGGYGYMHPTLGTWMMYDALSDAVMMNTLMHNHGYAATTTHTVYHDAPGSYSGASAFWSVFLTFMLIVIIFIGIAAATR